MGPNFRATVNSDLAVECCEMTAVASLLGERRGWLLDPESCRKDGRVAALAVVVESLVSLHSCSLGDWTAAVAESSLVNPRLCSLDDRIVTVAESSLVDPRSCSLDDRTVALVELQREHCT